MNIQEVSEGLVTSPSGRHPPTPTPPQSRFFSKRRERRQPLSPPAREGPGGLRRGLQEEPARRVPDQQDWAGVREDPPVHQGQAMLGQAGVGRASPAGKSEEGAWGGDPPEPGAKERAQQLPTTR